MMRRQRWWLIAAAAALLPTAALAQTSAPSRPAALDTWRLTTMPVPRTAHSFAEPGIAFAADGTALADAATANAGVAPALWLSRDDGAGWASYPFDNSGASTGDADVAIGSDGWFYALNLAYANPPAQPSNPTVFVYRSRDGKHWLGPASFPAPHAMDQPDRPWLLVDPRHPSNVDVVNSEVGGNFVLWRSVDHAATFAGPTPVGSGSNSEAALALSSRPVLDPSRDGRVFMFYETVTPTGFTQTAALPVYEFPTTQIWLASSVDAGATWSSQLVLDTANLAGASQGGILGHLLVASAVDQSGALYVAYSLRAPGATGTHIQLIRSSDHGVTWSRPLNISSSMNSNVMPAVAVAKGHAYISWYGSPSKDFAAADARWYEMVADLEFGGIDSAGARATDPGNISPSLAANWGLRDFQSIAVDRCGRPHPIWAVDTGRGATQTAELVSATRCHGDRRR
jgi:hypothetical protein